MAIRLALAHSSSRLILASIVTAAICVVFPETSFAGKFIAFTTPKVPASAGKDPTDLQITVTNGATISKGTAVLPKSPGRSRARRATARLRGTSSPSPLRPASPVPSSGLATSSRAQSPSKRASTSLRLRGPSGAIPFHW